MKAATENPSEFRSFVACILVALIVIGLVIVDTVLTFAGWLERVLIAAWGKVERWHDRKGGAR